SAFFLLAGIVLALPALAQNAGSENSVAIGDITKIDLKGKSITINNAVSYNIAPAVGGGARGGAGRGSGGGGRGGGGRGGGRRGGGEGGAPTGGGGFIPQTPR